MMNRLRVNTILVILLITILTGCDIWDMFYVKNNASYPIMISAEFGYRQYPDTVRIPMQDARLLKPSEKNYIQMSPGLRKTIFAALKTDVVSLYIFSPDTLEKNKKKKMQADYNILARYDITEELDKHFGGNFEYPPSQRMIDSGMKIYINPNNPDL